MGVSLLVTYSLNFYGGAGNSFSPLGTGGGQISATDAAVQSPYVAGSMTLLQCVVASGTVSGSSSVTLRKNAANGNNTISIAQAATGSFQDSTPHTDNIASNDLVNVVINAGDASFQAELIAISFTPSTLSNTVSKLTLDSGIGSGLVETDFWGICGTASGNTTEGQSKLRTLKTMSVNNLALYDLNSAAGSTNTVTSRKNGAAGALSKSWSSGNLIQETTHTDNLVSGDDWNIQIVENRKDQTSYVVFSADFISSNGDTLFCNGCGIPSSQSTDGQFNTSVTNYLGLGGTIISGETTENHTKVTVNNAFTFSNLLINVTSNGITSNPSMTLTLRANGGNAGSVAISVANSTTGVHSDNSDTYIAATTDAMNLKLVTGAAGTNMVIQQTAVWGNIASAAVTGSNYQHFDNSLKPSTHRQAYDAFGGQLTVFG